MRGSLCNMRNFALIHFLLFFVIAVFSKDPWPFLLLTIAQVFYVPVALRFIMKRKDRLTKYYFYLAIPAYISIALIQILAPDWAAFPAFIYFAFTACIALYGLSRFLRYGFAGTEELSIIF